MDMPKVCLGWAGCKSQCEAVAVSL